jgi:hypothetical protein
MCPCARVCVCVCERERERNTENADLFKCVREYISDVSAITNLHRSVSVVEISACCELQQPELQASTSAYVTATSTPG